VPAVVTWRLPAVAVVGPVAAAACLPVAEEPVELVEKELGYSGWPAEVELELALDLDLDLGFAGRQQRLVAAVVGAPVDSLKLELACSEFAAGSFGSVLVGCFLLVLAHWLAVALLLVGPSLTAVVDAGSVSQNPFLVEESTKHQEN